MSKDRFINMDLDLQMECLYDTISFIKDWLENISPPTQTKDLDKKVFGFKMIDKKTCDDLEKFNKKLYKHLDITSNEETIECPCCKGASFVCVRCDGTGKIVESKPIKKIEWIIEIMK